MNPRRKLTTILAGFVLIAIAAIAYVFWPSREVSVEVLNRSNQDIQSFSLSFSTCGKKQSISGYALRANESRVVKHQVCGEGAYVLEVILADGKNLKSEGLYVESGYTSTEVVTAERITSTQQMYAL